MGYFSRLAAERMECGIFHRECPKVRMDENTPRREVLEYHLEQLHTKLDNLEATRPHDPRHPFYDRMFYARSRCHYYENPETVQEIKEAISEVEELLWILECEERENRAERMKRAEINDLSRAVEGQILMISYWDYASIFTEAQMYRAVLPVISV